MAVDVSKLTRSLESAFDQTHVASEFDPPKA